MSPAQVDAWRYRIQNMFGIGIIERLARPKLWWFAFYAKPRPDAADHSAFFGGHVDVWVAHKDGSVAEQIARKVIADEQWLVSQLLSKKLVTRWTYKRRMRHFRKYAERSLASFDEAIRIGHRAEFHRISRDRAL
jgi:hypothetical protein